MKRIATLFLAIILHLQLQSHPWKPAHYVIIDTDGGIDDMRAICMMLASPKVRVLALTVSSGALSPENAYIKVRSLLDSFHHEGIPVGVNLNKIFNAKDFVPALQFKWGDEKNIDTKNAPDYLQVISEIFKYEKTKISFICLGSLNTADNAMKSIPDFTSMVQYIIWSSSGLNDINGFNFSIDAQAARNVLQGPVPVKVVGTTENYAFYNKDLVSELGRINNRYAVKINLFMHSETAKNHTFSLELNDELIPLCLHFPELFRTTVTDKNSESVPLSVSGLTEGYLKIIKGETVVRNQVIKELPSDPSFYFDDLKPFVSEIIQRYGLDEWYSGVLANELHRHLGVYTIIGVKMGIRAREYFNTGVDEFEAVSFAGSVSPLSCMNDGIQVSTGATPGHGLLTVKNEEPAPVVEFKYLGHKIRISLKPELAKKINDELKEYNFVYGLDSNIYWELVREKAIKYWRDFDRHEIFIIEVIK
ncbi:MAG: nucleoside hydrolase [Bacteroidales bacterium]